ncbi:hypothetical protein ACFPRH_30475 [Streptomyces amakusaensis]|uniref:DNA polymerase Y-family little finger domain-containing protein n=1 Tax=Streptomyces amakusaensis TaxID=67271 RepID=A0ABW0AV25_9ACTN
MGVGVQAECPDTTFPRQRTHRPFPPHRSPGSRLVQSEPTAQSLSAEHRFDRDTLTPGDHRRALLELAADLGGRLRDAGQAADGLTLTVRYADRTTTTRTRTLPEPTHHTRPLAATAYALHETLGLQRARVRAITLRAESLIPAADTARQLTLDPDDDRSITLEAVTDRARARYGPGAIKPATLSASRPNASPQGPATPAHPFAGEAG